MHYGYSPKLPSDPDAPAPLVNWEESITRMQGFLGIKKTGKLDDETLRVMKMPRCANPDVSDEFLKCLFTV